MHVIQRYRVASSCMTEVHLNIKKAGVLCAYLFILNIFYLLKWEKRIRHSLNKLTFEERLVESESEKCGATYRPTTVVSMWFHPRRLLSFVQFTQTLKEPSIFIHDLFFIPSLKKASFIVDSSRQTSERLFWIGCTNSVENNVLLSCRGVPSGGNSVSLSGMFADTIWNKI
jgi:hypothetical protein